ncbi:MAG: ABC transporter substrate-binding protein [Acidobacteriota bacterium]
MRCARFVLAMVMIFGLALPVAQARAAQLEKVRCSEAVRGFFFLPLYLGQALKSFEKQGIEIEFVPTQGGPLAMQALLSGDVEVCAIGHGQVANLYAQGKPTRIIFEMQDKCTFYLVGKPGVASLKDLGGKNMGVTKFGSETHGVGRALAAWAGFDPETGINMIETGGMGTMAAALEADRVQAALAWQPMVGKLEQAGKAKVLATLNTAEDSARYFGSPDYSFSVLQVTPEYAKAKPETLKRFVAAVLEAQTWLREHSAAEVAKLAAPYFEGMSEADIAMSVDRDRQAFSASGIVSRQGHDTAMRIFQDAKILTKPVAFEDLVDNSFTEAAKALKK